MTTLQGQGRSAIFERLGMRRFAGAGGRRNAVRGRGVHVEHAVLVRRAPEEVYRYWRRFENLPRFMSNLIEVRALGPRQRARVRRPRGVERARRPEAFGLDRERVRAPTPAFAVPRPDVGEKAG